jgi:protein-S-isoprenylcysteine O-methyltransferase Ste14
VAFLLIGTVLVLVDGQIIYRNGRKYLQQSAPSASAESLTKLVSVLFHLAVLGVLALISTIDIPTDTTVEGVVVRLGVILLVIGLAHWIAISALTRIRDRQEVDGLHQEREARRIANEQANAAYGTSVPVPTESPAYNGESATAAVNRPQPYQEG